MRGSLAYPHNQLPLVQFSTSFSAMLELQLTMLRSDPS